MIEIIEVTNEIDLRTNEPIRAALIVITNGGGASFMLPVGNLPAVGDLQAILDAREAELWTQAQVTGQPVDLYDVLPKRVLKAVALVIMDELNILRQRDGLAPRTAGQIDNAVKNKLKGMS